MTLRVATWAEILQIVVSVSLAPTLSEGGLNEGIQSLKSLACTPKPISCIFKACLKTWWLTQGMSLLYQQSTGMPCALFQINWYQLACAATNPTKFKPFPRLSFPAPGLVINLFPRLSYENWDELSSSIARPSLTLGELAIYQKMRHLSLYTFYWRLIYLRTRYPGQNRFFYVAFLRFTPREVLRKMFADFRRRLLRRPLSYRDVSHL